MNNDFNKVNYVEERKEIYTIDEVLSKVMFDVSKSDGIKMKINFDGDLINMTSDRYKIFIICGIKCVKCGIEGKFFAKERLKGQTTYHFNLYAIDDSGDEVLMTKDHIIPVSKGGKSHISNYQTMCKPCNTKKGNSV